jgi:autotransporter-associated beta strand protein
MKTLTRTLQTVAAAAAVAAILAMPHLASAATKKFTVSVSPTTTNVLNGVATNVTVTVTNTSTAGSFTGVVTNGVSVFPSGQGVTASFSSSSLIVISNSPDVPILGSASLTLYISATAGAVQDSVYTVTVTGTNTAATGNVPPGVAKATYTFIVGTVPTMVWSPGGIDTNWSTAGNWSPSGPPDSKKDVKFFDLGSGGTNVVNTSLTIGSLTYGHTNNWHTTLIPSGVTLTVGGDVNDLNGLVTGTGTDPGNGQLTRAAITGAGGALAVTNNGANVYVSQSHPVTSGESFSQATLDLSGLGKFTATISRLLVGVDLTIKGASGILNLARTNVITATAGSAAPQIDVGDNTQPQGSAGIPSILLLGQTNAFFADSIAVGRGKTDDTGSSMLFNSSFASPTAYFRGTNGNTSRVGTWSIGDAYGSKYTSFDNTVGTCDFSLGTVNALVDTMYVGKGADATITPGASIKGLGTLMFGAGTIDVNILQVGVSATATGTGTVNVNGGSLLVNTSLELANGSGSSGTLNISGGMVTANTGITAGGGSATINLTGGTLNVTNVTATIGTMANPLNTFSAANATINLAVRSTTPSVATVNLAAGGAANMINIRSVPLLIGFPTQFPIIQYGLIGGSASGDLTTFTLGTLPSASPAYGAYISNNTANSSIDIVFTNGPFVPALTWDGKTNGNWDTTTANWRPASGPDTTFGQGNIVTFDDTLTGTTNVNLTTALTPGALTVNNTLSNYVFSGSGSISGSVTLVKSGSGTLTLAETGGDNFSGGIIVNNGTVILDDANSVISGGTTINGGTIQVGNNDVNGTLPLGNVTDSGALIFNRADNIIVTNVISGAGTLTQSGANVMTLSGNNSGFTGTATVAQGTLQVGSTNALGSATSVTVSNAATFDVNGYALYGNGNAGLVVTVSGAGVGGNGAIINSGSDQSKVLHTVTLTGDSTFGGTGDWEIRNSSGNSAPADAALTGAFNLTKVGTNSITLRGVTVDTGLGDINVPAGSLSFTATASAPQNSLGDPNKTATVFSNATLTLDTIGIIPSKNFVLTNGGTLKSSGTNTLNSPLTLAGAANNTISVGSSAQFTITSAIGGAGGFSKNGSGPLFLTANNTYSGRTVVSGGTLALYGGGSDGSIASSTNISLNSGATLDVSGRSDKTLTLVSGQTLVGGVGTNGPGTINGLLVVSSGATVAPGGGGTNVAAGTLNVTSNLTLQGATVMKISATNGNDQIDAAGITYGGTLVVTNFSGAVTNGQSFQLFVATNGYSGTFSGGVTLPSATGLTWTNTLTTDGKITAGVVPPAQPIITSISLSGTSLAISGTNGTPGYQFILLSSTNLMLPLIQWTPIVTNPFTSGSFNITNMVDPSVPQNFYMLKVF